MLIPTSLVLIFGMRLTGINIVGTDLSHAVPWTAVAGVGHLYLGNVNFVLLGSLLPGSLPAMHFGSHLA